MKLTTRKFFVGLVVVIVPMILAGSSLFAQDLSNKLNMLEIVISNLIARVEALEKRVNTLEKNLSPGTSKAKKRGCWQRNGETFSYGRV